MQRRCSVPSCERDVHDSDTSSYYRFPLQEPARLRRWLRNMGRENWTPTRHQFVCHRHFAPSCFRERRGIRYLESDAVPTIFREKRKATGQIEKTSKKLHTDDDQSNRAVAAVAAAVAAAAAAEAAETENTLHLYDGASQDVRGGAEDAELTSERQRERVNRITVAVLTQGHRSVCAGAGAAPPAGGGATPESQVVAYFETIPSIALGDGETRSASCADTTLTFTLSSKPLMSVLPIVSKRETPPPVRPVHLEESMELEEGDKDEGDEDEGDEDEGDEDEGDKDEGDEDEGDEDGTETNDQQLEEHSYHKSSVAEQQLEVMVVELQRKMSALQQHHHRHLDKLLDVESSMSQLRHRNLRSEERLQLLESAYVHTGAAVTDTGETVTIIYDEDAAALLYTPLDEEL